ncbi:MAG: hypothetical protein ABIJ56_16905 [Pseudomonadota bacterium]
MRQSNGAAVVLVVAALTALANAGCEKSYEVTVRDPRLVSLEMNGKTLPEEGEKSAMLEDYLPDDEKKAFRDMVAMGAGPLPHVLTRTDSGAMMIATGYDFGGAHGRKAYVVDLLDSDGKMKVKAMPPGWKKSGELRIPHVISETGYAGGMSIDFSYETNLVTRIENVEAVARLTDTSDAAYGFGGTLITTGFLTAIVGIAVLAKTDEKDAGWGIMGGGLGAAALGIVLCVLAVKVPGFSKLQRTIYTQGESQ